MDAVDLDYRARTQSGCIPPHLVSRLLELGHAETVEFWAGRGEWFCVREYARLLGEESRRTEALEMLAPYLATGWWTATSTTAQLLETWGRADEAIVLTRARMKVGHPLALEFYARLLARHGRSDEAFTLLEPHIDDWFLAAALVDVARGAGQDERAAKLLAARIPGEHRCESPWCCRGLDPDTAIGLLATIRERQGHVDEAIALLRTRGVTSFNGRDQLADLLARHDRIDELRAYAVTEELGHAAQCLAELLEERGDVEGAIAVYRQTDERAASDPNSAVQLAQLLARHGRGNEAIEVMRHQADARNADDYILHVLSDLCLDQRRPEDGLAHLDAFAAARGGKEDWDLLRIRLLLTAACDRVDEAIERARIHPEGGTSYAAAHIAELLAGTGRTEEAVEVLRPHSPANSHDLAGYLIDLGRIEEAVAVLHQDKPGAPQPSTTAAWSQEPPF
ncbi:tetratricopeptide repeat protein [Streptomyces sp. NPDC059805]|uniref:tetratricopeptide repeat protein n=1 Tax=Streptomyces sp. NPDC059805 TaxID=3346954 RepID=UPI003650B598